MIVYREISSVEADLGFSAKTLYKLSNQIEKHYRRKAIPKRDGSFRSLCMPSELLKAVQRRIADKILALEPVSRYATAYKSGATPARNAMLHVGKDKLLKLDIYHFFDSILYSEVKDKAFPANRFSEQIRVLLTMLCYYKDALPQGAPTSPIITNIIMYDFDESVGAWCKGRGITYTRYCDDMTFSGSFDEAEVKEFVREELKAHGFLLNSKKTQVVTSAKRQLVTGIVVNQKANIPATYRRELRQELYFVQKYGIEQHLERISCIKMPLEYLQGLLGRVSFLLSVRPDDSYFVSAKHFLIEEIKRYQ